MLTEITIYVASTASRLPKTCQRTVLLSEQLYSVITDPHQRITGESNFVLRNKMCTAFQNHCPSCCTSHGEVYSQHCPVLHQLRPGQPGFVQIHHPIDEQNPKLALQTCGRCKLREQKQKQSWLKDKWARIKASERTPCEKCLNYKVEYEQPLRIIPLF